MNSATPVNDGHGNTVTLREYIEAIMTERDRALTAAFQAQQSALNLATRNLELRLEKLNELRQEVTQDRANYITRDKSEAEAQATDVRLSALENWRSRATGAAVILGLFAGVIGAALMRVFGG